MTRSIPVVALSVKEAAQSIGVSEAIVYAKIRTGELHAVRIGKEPGSGDLRIAVAELERLVSRQEAGE